MRIVIQRVNNALVKEVKTGKIVGKINKGLLLLVAIKKNDNKNCAEYLFNKIKKLRIFADKKNKMNKSIMDTNEEILIVSQFTLYADISKGNRPSFINSEDPKKAKILYDYFVSLFKNENIKTQIGSFGNYMKIQAELDGPVTILMEL